MSDYQPRGQRGWPAQPPADGEYGEVHNQAGHSREPAAAPRRRRRKRWPAVLLVVVIAILALLGIGDQVARSYAQNRIAQQIQTSAQLSAKPSVSIEGWPFLTQVAAHDLSAIDISANNVTTTGGKLPVNFTAKATGVHPNSSFTSATVNHITGQVTITYQALDNYLANTLGVPGLTAITLTPDPSQGPNVVKADLGGIGSVDATVVKTGPTTITIEYGQLGGLASLLGGSVQLQNTVIDIPKLPAGLVVGNPTATSQGVVIPATASNTTLTQ